MMTLYVDGFMGKYEVVFLDNVLIFYTLHDDAHVQREIPFSTTSDFSLLFTFINCDPR